jgi:hypothetical protein
MHNQPYKEKYQHGGAKRLSGDNPVYNYSKTASREIKDNGTDEKCNNERASEFRLVE